MLVTAENVRDAYDRLKDSLKDLMVDFEIAAIVSSPIIDIFPYFSPEEQAPEGFVPKAEYDASRESFQDEDEEEVAEEVEEETEVAAEEEEAIEEPEEEAKEVKKKTKKK